MRQTLLLDSSYYPLQMIDWKKALTLFFTERAEVVEHHQNIEIRSTSKSFKLPKVMRLFCKIGDIHQVKFSRMNIFYRDNFTCQYCSGKFIAKELTLDHVYPKSKGGKTDWENIVAACGRCNNKKSDTLLCDSQFNLIKKPFEPKWLSLFLKKLGQSEKILWKDWFNF
ncbi:MAG: HNH endonuclease [Halobacteriovoraceae bacterium]|jgi:5-methylcytosine-specific restriction endonuclease McrA|nr:HNH endonuclease [Halobacteriovoraceae bacterium]